MTVGLTGGVGGIEGTVHRPLPRHVVGMCAWIRETLLGLAQRRAGRGKKSSGVPCGEHTLPFLQQLEVVFCSILQAALTVLLMLLASPKQAGLGAVQTQTKKDSLRLAVVYSAC